MDSGKFILTWTDLDGANTPGGRWQVSQIGDGVVIDRHVLGIFQKMYKSEQCSKLGNG